MMENIEAMLLIGGGYAIGELLVIGLLMFVCTRKPVLKRLVAWSVNVAVMCESFYKKLESGKES